MNSEISPDELKRVADIFAEAIQRSPVDRAEYLQGVCPGDTLVRQEVEKLIQAHERAGDFLEHPAVAPPTLSIAADSPEASHHRELTDFGGYHVVGVLGEGGMGIVYLAEQRKPIRRRVALKVMKRTDDRSSFLARFETERQALALMDHPNIAAVYDAGTMADGRPYFAMEYVAGVSLIDYADRNLLGIRDRLLLFQQVCQAVQHAHQKGIIHRDLKPSNVLVTMMDGKAVPKVIDFGVAKAVNQRLTERTLFTEAGMLIGTPEYMSPEQADLTGLNVDTTTDVYSLGVILYELLVGALPFDGEMLRQRGYAEIQRIIREEEAPAPLTRFSGLGQSAAEIARRRRTDVHTLMRLVRGDLEWVTMKALDKDRHRRYASASEFAADITRHLQNEPVIAGPPSVGYRSRKFIRRHRGAVLAAGAVAISLLIGAVVSFSLYLRASRERESAEFASYTANLSAADFQLRAGQVSDARARLADAPAAFRGWEWLHLMSRTDQSSGTIYSEYEIEGVDVHVREGEIRFSEDGSHVFSYGDTFLRSWDTATKHLITDFSGFGRILAIGPYGKTVLVGPPLDEFADAGPEGFVLRLYDVESRRLLQVFHGLSTNPGVAQISDDGTLVAASPDLLDVTKKAPGPITVWDMHTGKVRANLEGHPDTVYSLRFSPDGRLLTSVATSRIVKVWDLAGNKEVAQLQHDSVVTVTAFSRDGHQLAIAGNGGTISIWDTSRFQPIRRWKTSSEGSISAAVFSKDSSLLATSDGQGVHLWDGGKGELLQDLYSSGGIQIKALAFHPSARLLFARYYGEIKEFNLQSRDVVHDTRGPIRATAVSPDGKYMASASEHTVQIYDARSRELLRSLNGHTDSIWSLAFSNDSSIIASGSSDKTVKVWTVAEGRLLRTLAGHSDMVTSLAFTGGDTRLISASKDQTIRIWAVHAGSPQAILTTTSPICSIVVSPDGQTIAALQRADKIISLWSTVTTKQVGQLDSDTVDYADQMCSTISLSQDGEILLGPAYDRRSVALWDFPNRRLQRIIPVYGSEAAAIGPLAISPDKKRVVIGSAINSSLAVWDLIRGSALVNLSGHSGNIMSLSWAPDGYYLVSSGSDQRLRVWSSQSPHNFEAELLLDPSANQPMLVEEVIGEITMMRGIPRDVRRQAIELVRKRGNPSYGILIANSMAKGLIPGRNRTDYEAALRRAETAIQIAHWCSWCEFTVALLQYRLGHFAEALKLANRTMELRKDNAREAYALRALTYHQLHDEATARRDLAMAERENERVGPTEDLRILREAEKEIPH